MCVLQRAVPVSTRGPSAPVFQGARKLRMKRNSTPAMLNGLEGKRVIITATGEGISKAITRAFLDAGREDFRTGGRRRRPHREPEQQIAGGLVRRLDLNGAGSPLAGIRRRRRRSSWDARSRSARSPDRADRAAPRRRRPRPRPVGTRTCGRCPRGSCSRDSGRTPTAASAI